MDDENVITLRPRGAAPPGLPPLPVGAPPPPAEPPAAPPPVQEGGADLVPSRDRRSAADSLAAIGADLPPLPAHRPGEVPATFRSEGADDDGQEPRLGALSLSALLAVALAALRGTATAVQDWRQRRLERQAETAPLRAARLKRDIAEAQHGATGGPSRSRVPSSHDWGRRAVGGGGGRSGSGGSGGSVPSRSSRSSAPSSSAGKGGGASRTGSGSVSGPGRTGTKHGSSAGGSRTSPSSGGAGSSRTSGPRSSGSGGKSSGDGGGGKRPKKPLGALGQIAVERSRRKSAREAAEQQHAARQHKADLAAARKGAKDGRGAGGGKTIGSGGSEAAEEPKRKEDKPKDGRVTFGEAVAAEAAHRFDQRRAEGLRHPFRVPQDQDQGEEPAATPEDMPPGGPEAGADSAGDPKDDPGPGAADWAFWTPPPRGERRSAEDSMRDATADEPPTVTVESMHVPGESTRRARYARAASHGLPAADPGTSTSTTTSRETPVSAPVHTPGPAGPAMSAEHSTEITLDDVLDFLQGVTSSSFATHDECVLLATKARELTRALDELAVELAARHNVIGNLTSAAMHRLAESTDLVARKAEEMSVSSLQAAEEAESAHTAMADAYRPVQQAAADAGLATPSARTHNTD